MKNIEPVKQKEKGGSKMMMVHRPKVEIKEDDLTKILSIPHHEEPMTKLSWSWLRVAKRPKPSAVSNSSVPTSSQQVATTEPPGFARKLALLSRKLTKVSDKLTPRHKLVKGGTKKPEKLLWLRAKLAKVGRRNHKQISFEVSQPSVEDMQETPRRKGGKMRTKFSGVFKKLPAMISKLSRPSKKK